MSWECKTLGDVATLMSGGTPRKSIEEYWNGDIPWFSAKDLTSSYLGDSLLHVTEAGASNGTRLTPANTVFFVVRGMSLANEFRVSISSVPATFNQDLKALKCKDGINPKFVFYSLFAQRDRIRQMAGEASHGTKKLPTEVVVEIPIKTPDETVQDRVVEVAEKYDLLIENNRRRIALLEESARLLYKEWFVHLRFPGHEHVKVVDGVPEGWERKALGDCVSIVKGKNITKDTVVEGDVPVVAGGLNPAYFHDTANAKQPVITVSASGANAGFVNIYQQDIWASDCSYISKDATETPFFFYSLLESRQNEVFGMQHGAAQPHVYPKDLVRLEVVYPPHALILEFEEVAEKSFSMRKNLTEQNQKLAEARDLLLPRLMNGEIEV